MWKSVLSLCYPKGNMSVAGILQTPLKLDTFSAFCVSDSVQIQTL